MNLNPDNIALLEREAARTKSTNPKEDKGFRRLAKSAFINGCPAPLLAIKFDIRSFSRSIIDGLSNTYISFIHFIDEDVILTWELIRIDNKDQRSFFKKFRLTNYTQDPNVDWGLFQCKLFFFSNEY